jgi:hypothetical protein
MVDGRNSEQHTQFEAIPREAFMVHRIVLSTIFGLVASIISGGVVLLMLFFYIRHLASTMPSGTSIIFGGILPCLCIMATAFFAAFLWRWNKA